MVFKLTSTIATKQKEDQFAKLVGEFGLWQLIVFASVFMVKLSSGWVQMAILFLTPKECVRYEFDQSLFESTIVSEWQLVCDRAWLASFTQMMLQLGVLLGSIVFGFLSDRFGRKQTFLLSVTLVIALGFGQPFAPSYAVFTAIRFLLGMATAGTMVISFVIVMEAIGSSYREMFGCLFQIPFIVGHMTVPAFAYFLRAWRPYLLGLAVPPLIYLGYFFVLSESPRWLLSAGKVDQAAQIVTKAAELNNLPTANIKEALTKISVELKAHSDQPKPNYLTLFKGSLRLKSICCCIIWLALGITFFGLNQYIGQTSSNPFIAVAAAGAIQIPANIISIWLIKQFGRRLTTSFFFCLCGVCSIALGCGPNTFWLSLTFGTLGVSFGAIVAATIYIYSSELFPTVVRNMGMGVSSMTMRVGSMIAPFVANLNTVSWLPTLVFGAVPIAAGLVVLMLPETKGQALSDCIEEDKQGS